MAAQKTEGQKPENLELGESAAASQTHEGQASDAGAPPAIDPPSGDTKASSQKLIKAIVADGRTVTVGKKDFGPGKEVSLPPEEVNHLRARGFLIDPDAPEIARGNGPVFESKEGPMVKVAA